MKTLGLLVALFAIFGIAMYLSVKPAHEWRRGPFDALIDHAPVCAARKLDTGNRIVLDGVLRGPCNSTDVGRRQ